MDLTLLQRKWRLLPLWGNILTLVKKKRRSGETNSLDLLPAKREVSKSKGELVFPWPTAEKEVGYKGPQGLWTYWLPSDYYPKGLSHFGNQSCKDPRGNGHAMDLQTWIIGLSHFPKGSCKDLLDMPGRSITILKEGRPIQSPLRGVGWSDWTGVTPELWTSSRVWTQCPLWGLVVQPRKRRFKRSESVRAKPITPQGLSHFACKVVRTQGVIGKGVWRREDWIQSPLRGVGPIWLNWRDSRAPEPPWGVWTSGSTPKEEEREIGVSQSKWPN